MLGFLYKIRSDHVKTALGAEKGGGYPEISKLRRSPATICHGVRRYHEDTPDGVYHFFYFAFTTDTFTSYVSLCYVYFSLFDTYTFTLEHVTTVYWIRRKGNSVYCEYSGGVLYSAYGKASSPPSSS